MENITYVVDADLIRFGKFAIAILGIFIVVGVSLFGFSLKDMAKQLFEAQASLKETHAKLDAAQARMDAGLQLLQNSEKIVRDLQSETEHLRTRAEEAVDSISQRERRSRELLIAMQTMQGQEVIRSVPAKERESTVIRNEKLWFKGDRLKLAFLGGTEDLQKIVQDTSSEWTKYANLEFDFNATFDDADLRIAFERGGASWSYVGRDALNVSSPEPTMNIDPTWPENDIRAAVLLYFGHAIGLLKEHQNPNATIPWDKDRVYQILGGAPNFMDKAAIDHNIFATWPENSFPVSKEYDPYSIMHYPIPKEWTRDSVEIDRPTELSDGDKEWIAILYPKSD